MKFVPTALIWRPGAGVLEADRSNETVGAGSGAAVDRRDRVRPGARGGREHDHLPGSGVDHGRQDGLQPVKDHVEVHALHALPLVDAHVEELADDDLTGDKARGVDAPEPVEGAGHECPVAVGRGQVDVGDRVNGGAGRFEGRDLVGEGHLDTDHRAVAAGPVEDEVEPAVGEGGRQRRADVAGRHRDECHRSLRCHLCILPTRRPTPELVNEWADSSPMCSPERQARSVRRCQADSTWRRSVARAPIENRSTDRPSSTVRVNRTSPVAFAASISVSVAASAAAGSSARTRRHTRLSG
jgi:hypothetical protein